MYSDIHGGNVYVLPKMTNFWVRTDEDCRKREIFQCTPNEI